MTPRILHLRHGQAAVYPDVAALTRTAAEEIVQAGRDAIRDRGRFDLALAGGSTPRAVYQLLAAEYAGALDWDHVHLFFGDERHVPPEHPDSNYRMARESLLTNPALRPRVHRIHAELPTAAAADHYENELRAHFQLPPPGQPAFDLVLLGMGADGHTASLFPGTAALLEDKRAVVANAVPQLNTERITLTFPCLNAARRVLFLTAGADKAAMLAHVLAGDPSGTSYPAQHIRSASGPAVWLTDAAAARVLLEKTSGEQSPEMTAT